MIHSNLTNSDQVDKKFQDTKIIIITHSYGSFFGTQLCIDHPNIYTKLLMLDPTLKTGSYFKYLTDINKEFSNTNKELSEAKLSNFEFLPDFKKLIPKIMVRIHYNYSTNNKNLIERDSLECDSIERDSLERDSIERNSLERDSIERDSIERDSIITNYNSLTNKNTKSMLILHVNVSHMIHYKIPNVIISSILEFCNV